MATVDVDTVATYLDGPVAQAKDSTINIVVLITIITTKTCNFHFRFKWTLFLELLQVRTYPQEKTFTACTTNIGFYITGQLLMLTIETAGQNSYICTAKICLTSLSEI